MGRIGCAISLAVGALLAEAALAAPPTPYKIVIVIEENQSFQAVVGSPDAPYIDSLAAGGANFTNFYGITHPSQPNYFELYAGHNQNVIDNTSPPPGVPFNTPNLGAAMLAAGKSFAIYSEDLPAVGSNVVSNGKYVRRHNPVVNWQSSTPLQYQYGPQHNRPFTDFAPTGNFHDLPEISFVVPNNDNNMHDGTIAEGDTWLRNNIKPYADWAMQNNSLLVITYDEDSFQSRNKIPTIFYGPMMKAGPQAPTWTLHNLLRTLEDMHETTQSGISPQVRAIVGAFVGDPEIETKSFSGSGAVSRDTFISSAAPTTNNGSAATVNVSTSASQGLIRFDSLFGNGAGQVPVGADVVSAKLTVTTVGPSFERIWLHRMLVEWNEASTWNSLGSGVSTNDVEAAASGEFYVQPHDMRVPPIFDVSDTVQLWADGAVANLGWMMRGIGTADQFRFHASEAATAAINLPTLEITYERPQWKVDGNGVWSERVNWVSGVPSGAGARANFLGNISAPRTVAIDSAVTVGSMTFDSHVAYTVAGLPISLASLPGVATRIDVMRGAHSIVADVGLGEDTPVNVADGARLDVAGVATVGNGATITKSGAGRLHAGGGINSSGGELVIEQGVVEAKFFNGISNRISAGARGVVSTNGTVAATSKVTALEIAGAAGAWLGQMDLNDNALVIQADAATRMAVLGRVVDQISSGRNSGEELWGGMGIASGAAAQSQGIFGLGVRLNDDGNGTPLFTSLRGRGADVNSILVMYTLVGDVDLDLDIDGDDYARIDAGYAGRSGEYWNGDLDYSGVIDADDYFWMDRAYSSAANQAGRGFGAMAAVPEPGVASFMMGFGALFVRRPVRRGS